MLSQTTLAVVLVPGFTFGALVVNYLFEQYAIYPTADRKTNVVVALAATRVYRLVCFGSRWPSQSWIRRKS